MNFYVISPIWFDWMQWLRRILSEKGRAASRRSFEHICSVNVQICMSICTDLDRSGLVIHCSSFSFQYNLSTKSACSVDGLDSNILLLFEETFSQSVVVYVTSGFIGAFDFLSIVLTLIMVSSFIHYTPPKCVFC